VSKFQLKTQRRIVLWGCMTIFSLLIYFIYLYLEYLIYFYWRGSSILIQHYKTSSIVLICNSIGKDNAIDLLIGGILIPVLD
jgi:hypothetical protein|tara:strand:- start:13239 stop:13484 length:246 start_codon:yes stop_codon:yes gene_type:complete